jgi:hypothetical protein
VEGTGVGVPVAVVLATVGEGTGVFVPVGLGTGVLLAGGVGVKAVVAVGEADPAADVAVGVAVGLPVGVAVGTVSEATIATSTIWPKRFPWSSASCQSPVYEPLVEGAVRTTET